MNNVDEKDETETHELSYQIAYCRSLSLNSKFLRLSVVTLMEYLVAMIIISQHKGITNEIFMYLSYGQTHPMNLIKFQSSKILSDESECRPQREGI